MSLILLFLVSILTLSFVFGLIMCGISCFTDHKSRDFRTEINWYKPRKKPYHHFYKLLADSDLQKWLFFPLFADFNLFSLMNTFLILFSDGNSLTTGFNGSLADAKAYYLNQSFSFMRSDESEFKALGISVTQL